MVVKIDTDLVIEDFKNYVVKFTFNINCFNQYQDKIQFFVFFLYG